MWQATSRAPPTPFPVPKARWCLCALSHRLEADQRSPFPARVCVMQTFASFPSVVLCLGSSACSCVSVAREATHSSGRWTLAGRVASFAPFPWEQPWISSCAWP